MYDYLRVAVDKRTMSIYPYISCDVFCPFNPVPVKIVSMSSDVYAVVLLYQLPCKHASYEPCPSSNENDYHQTTFSMTSFIFLSAEAMSISLHAQAELKGQKASRASEPSAQPCLRGQLRSQSSRLKGRADM